VGIWFQHWQTTCAGAQPGDALPEAISTALMPVFDRARESDGGFPIPDAGVPFGDKFMISQLDQG
jgi:hypothetical protein